MNISDALSALEQSQGDKSYSIIKLNFATGYFSQSALLARGSNALVYHAKYYMFGDGSNDVLVKNLDASCVQDLDADDFVDQLSLVLTLKDEHLIELCGYCFDEDKRLLVYEYAPLGSLYDLLYGSKGLEGAEPGPVLTWAQRAKIAYGAAKGLEYLHERVEPSIVHGEVRSSNVLVFSDFESKIGDFKLPRVMTGEITDKSDVYDFGVVLLQLLTGRKVVDDTLPEEQQDLVTWATPYLTAEKVEHIIDPRLNGDFPHNEVAKVAAIAQLCVQVEADFRPNMTILVRALEPLPEQERPKAYENESLVALTLEDLNAGTQRFTQMSLVAKSSYGKLYIGMARGMVVAIKKLDVNSQVSDADFEAQLTVASQIQHENLVELLGYCMEEGSRILVFELAMKGSLYDVLYGRKGVHGAEPGPVIPWSERVKIAYEAAQGLRYLHDVANPTIVHGDFRSSNVLLFYEEAKIGDFNITKVLSGQAQELTPAADVYDFGIVLLELLTGRKAVDLLKWASSYQSGDNVEQMLDPKLDGNFPLSEAVKMGEMAWLCVQDEAALRPSMSTVVETLESLVNVDLNDESCGTTNVDKITNPDISDAMAAVEIEGRSYQFFELNDTTFYFNPLTLLAKGSIASVYRADFRISGVGYGYGVVKKLDVSSVQNVGAEDFAAQMSLVSTLRNDYVMGLNGYCFEEDNLLLVYEYADFGSLHDILHGRKGLECAEPGPVLNWYQRAKIAYGAAKGLEYLHETVVPSIVHGEVRSSNVLVFYDFSAKIGDFMVPRVMTGEITDKSDVYNFGVVLLELLTGRKAVDDTKSEEQQDLAKWATPYLAAEKVEQIVDPRLNGKFPRRAVAKLAALVQLCIQEEPDSRPNMTTVVTALEPLHVQIEAFKLDDLNIATSRFSQMSLVAKRSYGELYCAILEDSARLAAVKKLDAISSQVSEEDFVDQLTVVSKLKHDHFTELLGYCIEEDKRFLIYEFATAGSLYDVLHGRKGVGGAEPGDVIPWDNRMKFAYEAAKGLEYLHDVAMPSIVHGDIRSSNVMLFVDLQSNYEAKIADFNLTNQLLDLDDAPDLNADDSAEKKTWRNDVYDFGIVLLELVTGRKAVDNTMPEGEQDLVKWASSYQSGDDVEQMVDPRLNGDFTLSTVVKVAEIAWLCVQDEAALRPYMSTVVETLETLLNA